MNTENGLRFLHSRAVQRLQLALLVLTLVVALTSAGTVWAQVNETTPAETYTVQRGDSWTSIAEGNGLTVAELKEANPQSIRTNDWLNVGEEIIIPGGDAESSSTGEPDEADSGEDAAEVTVHIVGGGESWNSIANLYDVALSELMDANPHALREREVLHRGDELVIPQENLEQPDDVGIDESDMQDEVAETEESASEESVVGEEETVSDATSTEPELVPEQSTDSETEETTEETDADDAMTEDVSPEDTLADDGEAEGPAAGAEPETYTVQPGESWNSIARKLGVDPSSLLAANAETVRPGEVLYTGDVLIIPTTEGVEPVDSLEGDTEPVEEDVIITEMPSCPEAFGDYPQALTDALNASAGGAEGLAAWLSDCGAQSEEEIVIQE